MSSNVTGYKLVVTRLIYDSIDGGVDTYVLYASNPETLADMEATARRVVASDIKSYGGCTGVEYRVRTYRLLRIDESQPTNLHLEEYDPSENIRIYRELIATRYCPALPGEIRFTRKIRGAF